MCLFAAAAIVGSTYDVVFRKRMKPPAEQAISLTSTAAKTEENKYETVNTAAVNDEGGSLPLKEGAVQAETVTIDGPESGNIQNSAGVETGSPASRKPIATIPGIFF